MKRILLILIIAGCNNPDPNVVKAQRRVDDIKCKGVELDKIMSYDESLIKAHRLGMGDEWLEAQRGFIDTTLTCGEAKLKWKRFWDKLHSKN